MAACASFVGARRVKFVGIIALLAGLAKSAPAPEWTLIQDDHFEIYSQHGDNASVRASLLWFEQLQAFFAAAGLNPRLDERVRVIAFGSVKDYDSYRSRPTADAYYIGTDTRDYIVMPSLAPDKFGVAAHEYAHVVLRAASLSGKAHLPGWLEEGLAEFFSTVHISNNRCEIGGDIRGHLQTLRSRTWMPISRLLEAHPASLRDREQSSLFYAQSWALTKMLIASPAYRTQFPALVAAISSGQKSDVALEQTYGRSLGEIAADMRTSHSEGPILAPGITVRPIKAKSSELTSLAASQILAELLLAAGELDRAQAIYEDLSRESPQNTEISAALGTIALRKGDSTKARAEWRHAIEQGSKDANLCYQYAAMAEDAGVSIEEVRAALERAISLKPDFDDARFKLALLESSASHYESALNQLKAMRVVAPNRAFGYWVAMAFAQDQLGQHDNSNISAQKALQFAITEHERAQARELAYVADTELTVQFTRDADGNPTLTTTRVVRGARNWNPFIEPQDQLRQATGQLRTVECGGNKIVGITIDTTGGLLQLLIPDPQHVLIQGASEFTCGPQPARAVTVEYAAFDKKAQAAGILRGMEIR